MKYERQVRNVLFWIYDEVISEPPDLISKTKEKLE